jgi:hypothetical protein
MQDGRRYNTLCGAPVSIDMPTTERASNDGTNYVICPMCALAKQDREEGYPDSPEPLSTLALREAVFVMLAHLNITVPEVADRLHTDPDRLYRDITTAKIGLGELAEFCEAIGISVTGLFKFTNTIQTDIIERRNNHKEADHE